MAVGLLPRYIKIWHERYPDVGIRLQEFRHRSLLEELADREWVLYHQDHGLAGILDEICRQAGRSDGRVRAVPSQSVSDNTSQ